MPRKARNQVRKRNLLKMRNQTQVVNVVVKNTKTIRKKENVKPSPTEPVMSRNRLLAPTPSVTVMNQQPDYKTLLSLLSATGRTPQPIQPSQGLINNPPNVPQSQGLGALLLQNTPVQSPKRDSMKQADSSNILTPATRLYTEKEKVRRWLLNNFQHIPPSGKFKYPHQQIDRVEQMKDTEALLKLYQMTKEYMKQRGIKEKIPEGLTPKDYEKENRQSLGDLADSSRGAYYADQGSAKGGGGGAMRQLRYDLDMSSSDSEAYYADRMSANDDERRINELGRRSNDLIQEMRDGLS